MNVIIFYEHKVREVPSVELIKTELEGRGCKVAVFSISFEWYSAYIYAKKNGIDLLIVPWCYSKQHFKYITPFKRINENVKIINLHHEQISSKLTEDVLMCHDSESKERVYHFCWSEYFKEKLIDNGVPESRIRVVGNLRMSLAKEAIVDKASIALQYGLDENKKWILFCESRKKDRVNYNQNKKHFIDLFGMDEYEYDAMFKLSEDSLSEFWHQVQLLPEGFFDKYELIYRPHPGSVIEQSLDARVRTIFDRPLSDWIPNIDVFCTWQSTSAFEADIAGVPVLIHECIPIPDELKMPGVSDYTIIKELSEIDQKLIDECCLIQSKRKIYQRYQGDISRDILADYTNSIIEIGESGEVDEAVTVDSGWVSRMAIFESVSKILYKLKLIKKLKWPNSAYMMFEDIPYFDERYEGMR